MGTLKYSPQVFLDLEPYECMELIEKCREREEIEHRLLYLAVRNAIGVCLSKKYKYEDIFKKEKNNQQKEVTEEERQRLKEYFESW